VQELFRDGKRKGMSLSLSKVAFIADRGHLKKASSM
jgi:hypothetical protein